MGLSMHAIVVTTKLLNLIHIKWIVGHKAFLKSTVHDGPFLGLDLIKHFYLYLKRVQNSTELLR